jgi:hypothetical protein
MILEKEVPSKSGDSGDEIAIFGFTELGVFWRGGI